MPILARVGRGLEHALAGRARRRVDDVRPAVDLRLGELAAFDRVVPGGGRGAGHVGDDFVAALRILDALGIAAFEGRDQRNIHAADETDLAGLGRLSRDHAHQERAFLRFEHHGLDVGLVDDRVDDRKLGVGEFFGDLAERGRPCKPGHQDRAESVLGELAQDLLALRIVLDLEVAEGDARLLRELGGAVEDAFVEGFVELAAEIVDYRGLDVGRMAAVTRLPAMSAVVSR